MQAAARRHRDRVESTYGVLDGFVGSPTQQKVLDTLLRSNWEPEYRRWMIDNSDEDDGATVRDVLNVVDILRRHSEKLSHLTIAWVTTKPCDVSLERLREVLPFEFRAFTRFSEAERWLRRQAMNDPGAEFQEC